MISELRVEFEDEIEGEIQLFLHRIILPKR